MWIFLIVAQLEEPASQPVEVDWTEQTANAYVGWRINLTPGILISGKDVGYSIGASLGYGLRWRRMVLVPMLAPQLYLSSPVNNVFNLLGKLQVVIPAWRFAPFITVGVGPGFIIKPFVTGLALFGGVGVVFHVASDFAIGVQGSYEVIVGTLFSGWGIAPVVMFSF